MLFAPVDGSVETNVAERVRLERRRDGVENDLHRNGALTQRDLRLDGTADGAILDDAERAKLEVRLLFQVELVDVPRTASARSFRHSLPVVWIVFHDDEAASLTLGNEFASTLARSE